MSKELLIRRAEERDRTGIIETYMASQRATGIPSPESCAPELLGEQLYRRLAIARFVVMRNTMVAGHGLVELPNPDNIPVWLSGTNRIPESLLELGGAFVHPECGGEGIWTALLEHRLRYVRSAGKTAVTATWASNTHVQRVFERSGAHNVGMKSVRGGDIALFRFD